MSKSLFIDSTEALTIGLLDENLEWLEFERVLKKKNAGTFHALVDDLLAGHDISLFDLAKVYHSAGPGSYTGIRLVEGLCQILKWQKIKTNSFYLFDIPVVLGEASGVWVSEAYKGEIFCHEWNEENKVSQTLIKKKDIGNYLGNKKVFSQGNLKDIESYSVFDLLRSEPKRIFSHVDKLDISVKPFYYRTIETEFTKPRRVLRN